MARTFLNSRLGETSTRRRSMEYCMDFGNESNVVRDRENASDKYKIGGNAPVVQILLLLCTLITCYHLPDV